MPSETQTQPSASAVDTFEDLRELLPDLEDHEASHDDLDLLNEVLGDPEYQALADIFDSLTMGQPPANDIKDLDYYEEVMEALTTISRPTEDELELRAILEKPHLRALIQAHDDVATSNYDDGFAAKLSMFLAEPLSPVFEGQFQSGRYVTIRKQGKEPLGITVRMEDSPGEDGNGEVKSNLIVTRILQGSLAAKQNLLHVGDIVKKVNGTVVHTPERLMSVLKDSEEYIVIKIIPSAPDQLHSDVIFVKACFNYNPMIDRLIPCKRAGLPFQEGDILAVVDSTDENWWQAKLADLPGAPVGLIPSRTLHEKRQAFVQPELTKSKSSLFCGLKTKRKKQIVYNSSNTNDFDVCDIKVYEQVERATSHRRVILLVGASGVGKRSLKERLLRDFPDDYSAAIPDTSRPPKAKEQNGKGYFFVNPVQMEADIKNNLYIDYGDFQGHLYGIRLTSIRRAFADGKTCVLDVAARSLKFLMTPEFRPLVVFIAAPSVEAMKVMRRDGRRLNNNRPTGMEKSDLYMEEDFLKIVKASTEVERQYKGMFDEVIVNDDFDTTYKALLGIIETVQKSQQWVPLEWNENDRLEQN